MKIRSLGAALCALPLFALTYGQATYDTSLASEVWKRAVNQTEYDACTAIQNAPKTSSSSSLIFLPYTADNLHYMTSSSQASTCVYVPQSAADLAAALKIIGSRRIRFAVSCSGHASNQGFSSTPGIHISMHGFQDVTVSADKTYVDVGGGISWADVYKKLDSSTVHVVGGRVPGPGIGGFVTGGGGYSWITNQYGLTGDNLISVQMLLPNGTLTTASENTNTDLFWAIKGGGNRFGIIYSFRLNAYPRPAQVYAGTATFSGDQTPALLDAIADFSANNKDPKAQIIPAVNYLLGAPINILLAYYDGIPSYDPFRMFNVSLQKQTFNSFVQSLGVDALQAGQRGTFNTVSLQKYSEAVLVQVRNQSTYWGKSAVLNSGTFISYDIEPFLDYSKYAKDAAWPHTTNALPLNLYFAWTDPSKDTYWQNAILESSAVIAATAKQDGQNLDSLLLYPNYAFNAYPAERLYGSTNVARLLALQRKYDPQGIMLLTTFFQF